MGERHVDELFSAVFDDELSAAERERYEVHLAGCERCTAAYDDFRAAVDAVRALPPARMPVRVVLPATPPVAERRSWLPRLWVPRSLGPAWGAGVMGAAGIAAVVIAVHVHGGGTAGGGTNALARSHANLLTAPHAAAGTAQLCAQPVVSETSADTAAGSPAGFANRVAVTNPQRPGQELVLATTSSRYSPGEQVLVFAALTTSSTQHTAVVPCVSLVNASSPSTGSVALAPVAGTNAAKGLSGSGANQVEPDSGMSASGAGGSWASIGLPPLAVAVPTSQSIAGTLPVQVLTIPRGLAPGTVLHLIALIPAGVPGSSDQPAVEAVLTVVVS